MPDLRSAPARPVRVAIIGGAIGLGIRDGSIAGIGLAFATMVAGLLVLAALILIWRGMSEFYLAVFRIAEDLRVLRTAVEADQGSLSSAPGVPQPSMDRGPSR